MRNIETVITNKFLPVWLYVIGLMAVVTAPIRLTDSTHEIQIIGTAWFRGGSIPLVQAFSNFGPLNLLSGSFYERFFRSGFEIRLIDMLIYTLVAILLFYWLKLKYQSDESYRNTLLLLATLIIMIPGVWQIGINPTKLGLIFLLGLNLFYSLWQKSGESYWLFGKTTKNVRYALLSGLMLSGLVFSSLLLSLLAIPVFVNFAIQYRRDVKSGLKWSLFWILPVFVQGWVWYSYFASRGLFLEALRAATLDFRLGLSGEFNFAEHAVAIFPIAVLVALALAGINRTNFYSSKKSWLIGLAVLVSLAASWNGIIFTLPFIFLLCAPLHITKIRYEIITVWCLLGLMLSLPYRFLDKSTSDLATAQAKIADAYIEQRIVDTNYVLYYGRGAGFFTISELVGSSRFYNSGVLAYDTKSLGLVDKFRGDNEANTPMFVVYATNDSALLNKVPRVEAYFEKHYDEVSVLDGYRILKRN